MQSHPLSIAISLAVLCIGLSGCAQPNAEPDRSTSLYERRLAVTKGTATGIVIFGGKSDAAPAAPAAAGGSTPTPGAAATTTAAAPAAATPSATPTGSGSVTKLFSTLPPPSGIPLNTLKRLDSPTLGIPFPTAQSASQPKSSK
jgi:hypothetical protein